MQPVLLLLLLAAAQWGEVCHWLLLLLLLLSWGKDLGVAILAAVTKIYIIITIVIFRVLDLHHSSIIISDGAVFFFFTTTTTIEGPDESLHLGWVPGGGRDEELRLP